MPSFDSGVNPPGGASYTAPAVNFGILGDLYKTYQDSQLSDQEKQLRALALQKQQQDLQQQQQLRSLFQGGLPTKDGQIDYQAITQALAKAGDINVIPTMAPLIQGQQPGQVSPLLLTGGSAPAAAPASAPPGPTTGPRGDLPPASAASGARTTPTGDSGSGTVMSIVAGQYGDASADTGRTASEIARKLGVDPNAQLTPGQVTRATGLLANDVRRNGGTPAASAQPPTAGAAGAPPNGTQPTAAAPAVTPLSGVGTGTVASIVAEKYGAASPETGQLMSRVSRAMGVDPNQQLTPGQERRAQGLLSLYGGTSNTTPGITAQPATEAPAGTPQAEPITPNTRVAEGFAPVGPGAAARTPQTPAPASVVPSVAAGAPSPQSGQPIIPQPPLPRGYSDPQLAIQALHTAAVEVLNQPKYGTLDQRRAQAKELGDWATRIENSQKPLEVHAGTRLVSPTGQTLYASPERPMVVGGNLVQPDAPGGPKVIYQGASPLSSQAIDDAARVYVDTGKFPPNMGRGVQGDATRNAILERASGMESELGLDPADRASRWQGYATHAAGLRVLEQRSANMTLVESETKTLIPRVRALLDTVPRTNYPDLNRIILAGKEKTGDPNVVKLGIAIDSLVPVYARLLKPTGQIGVTDTENARHILVKAWSDGQIRAALDQMEVERKAAQEALAAARKEFGPLGRDRSGRDAGAAAGSDRAPDRVIDGKSFWQVNGRWFDNPEGK